MGYPELMVSTPRGPQAERALPTRAVRMRYDEVSLGSLVAEIPSVNLPTAEVEERLRPLYRKLGFKAGWVEAVTGIGQRRMWSPGERFLDGGLRAARRAMAEAGVEPRHIQAVVSCSVYRDRLEPSLACEIQGGLGIPSTAMNFDVANACLGFLTGLTMVSNMVALGQIEAGLVVAAEDAGPVLAGTLEQLSHPSADIQSFKNHLATLTLGSAAAAAVVMRHDGRPRAQLHGGATLSATEHHTLCMGDARSMSTDSVRLLREGVALAARTWSETQDALGWAPADVDTFALHQVGKAHHESVLRALGVDLSRAPQIYPWLGNIGSCGVPVTAALARQQGVVKPGQRMALMGIGSGLNCLMLGMTW